MPIACLGATSQQAMGGGEGMTEELRDHLLQHSSPCIWIGATDIEIGMAGESPASVAIRDCGSRPDLRACPVGDDSRLPMVFQSTPHPLLEGQRRTRDHLHISGWTCWRRDPIYNVHDEGASSTTVRMMERSARLESTRPPLARSAG